MRDGTATSPFYGHCYIEWDLASNGDLLQMSTSSDGGNTWSAAQGTGDNATGSWRTAPRTAEWHGNCSFPATDNIAHHPSIAAFSSTDGGASLGKQRDDLI